MDKMADGLQKLGEDDLLQVVQMVHENKSADSYTKNDIERMLRYSPSPHSFALYRILLRVSMYPEGEFHVDLYTLPDTLLKMLWDFCVEKGVA